MEAASNNSIVFVLLLLLIAVAFLIYRIAKSKIKGPVGELAVSLILSRLNNTEYKILNNIVLERNGITSQIDHLVISKFGVFVIETKNFKGWITGGENSEYWNQTIFKFKARFYNPIRQNLSHISVLKNCLPLCPNLKYISIIVFSPQARIMVRTNTHVVARYNLISTIKQYSSPIFDDEQVSKVYEQITSLDISRKYDKRNHIQTIKQRVSERQRLVQRNICPRCGKALKIRNGKFGEFWGCSNYPKCNFTAEI